MTEIRLAEQIRHFIYHFSTWRLNERQDTN